MLPLLALVATVAATSFATDLSAKATLQSLDKQPVTAAQKAKTLAELRSFFKKAGKPFEKADKAQDPLNFQQKVDRPNNYFNRHSRPAGTSLWRKYKATISRRNRLRQRQIHSMRSLEYNSKLELKLKS